MIVDENESGATVSVPTIAVDSGNRETRRDELAAEEPLEVRVRTWDGDRQVSNNVSVTMRTPGNDYELAAGFLFTEGIVHDAGDIEEIGHGSDPFEPHNDNIVNIDLRKGVEFDPKRLSRHVYTSSSCGVCGKASLELVRTASPRAPSGELRVAPELVLSLPETLRQSQKVFSRTGGLHASALFDEGGRMVILREDVGRHNALDKVVGALLLKGMLPASNRILLVSGRSSFELVQKAVIAGIPVILAIGAPSSLAVALAREYGVTLIGFIKNSRFNVYSGEERIGAAR